MKTRTLELFIIVGLALTSNSGHAQEEKDLQSATIAIASEILLSAHPKTRSRCSQVLCIGVSQAELGLQLISARSTPLSNKHLAELIRFRLDGSIGEDYACVIANRHSELGTVIKTLKPDSLRNICLNEYDLIVRGNSSTFAWADSVLLCRSIEEIEAARSELTKMITLGATCPP